MNHLHFIVFRMYLTEQVCHVLYCLLPIHLRITAFVRYYLYIYIYDKIVTDRHLYLEDIGEKLLLKWAYEGAEPSGPCPPQNSLVPTTKQRNFTYNKICPENKKTTTFTRTYLFKAEVQSQKNL